MLEDIEKHWGMFKNKSAVVVFAKYAERGHCIVNFFTSRHRVGECQPSKGISQYLSRKLKFRTVTF